MINPSVPHLQIRYDSIVTYPQTLNQLIGDRKMRTVSVSDLIERLRSKENGNGEKLNYKGLVSPAVARLIGKKVDLLLQISPYQTVFNPITSKSQRFQLVFITLTIPAQDEQPAHRSIMKECFKPIITHLKNKSGVNDYVWKAELQKNGTIHYHIATNRFIHYSEIKNEWNRLLDKCGLLNGFKREHGHSHPNSTDIHAAKSSRQIRNYIRKYMSKSNDDDRPIDGKVWGCSLNLKRSVQFSDFIYTDQLRELMRQRDNGEIKTFESDYSTTFLIMPHLITLYLTNQQNQAYRNHIDRIKKFKVDPQMSKVKGVKNVDKIENSRLSKALKAGSQFELQLKIQGAGVMKSHNR